MQSIQFHLGCRSLTQIYATKLAIEVNRMLHKIRQFVFEAFSLKELSSHYLFKSDPVDLPGSMIH